MVILHNATIQLVIGVILLMPVMLCAQQRRCVAITPQTTSLVTNSFQRVNEPGTLYIPVIFHVVYANANHNISDEQIRLQLQVINEDFSMSNANVNDTRVEFRNVAANVNIQFYMANLIDQPAIIRTSTSHGPFYNDDLHYNSSGGNDAYHTDQYLNVWIADLAAGVFGYGSAPGTNLAKDGVAVHYEYFGKDISSTSHYKGGRTLTHEIGHWLGLQHPWGTSGECLTDDGLSDTPPQSAPTFGCALDQVSCGSLTMIQNFMNTSYDKCMTLFTLQQKELMRQTLLTARKNTFSNLPPVITSIDKQNRSGIPVLYPNPVTDAPVFYIRLGDHSQEVIRIALFDVLGKEVAHWTMRSPAREYEVNVDGISKGMYVARIEAGDKHYEQKIYLNNN